jgi:hypothetical protein
VKFVWNVWVCDVEYGGKVEVVCFVILLDGIIVGNLFSCGNIILFIMLKL